MNQVFKMFHGVENNIRNLFPYYASYAPGGKSSTCLDAEEVIQRICILSNLDA